MQKIRQLKKMSPFSKTSVKIEKNEKRCIICSVKIGLSGFCRFFPDLLDEKLKKHFLCHDCNQMNLAWIFLPNWSNITLKIVIIWFCPFLLTIPEADFGFIPPKNVVQNVTLFVVSPRK